MEGEEAPTDRVTEDEESATADRAATEDATANGTKPEANESEREMDLVKKDDVKKVDAEPARRPASWTTGNGSDDKKAAA